MDAGDDFTSEFTKIEDYTGEATVYEATVEKVYQKSQTAFSSSIIYHHCHLS